jgi:hypothetical protein
MIDPASVFIAPAHKVIELGGARFSSPHPGA